MGNVVMMCAECADERKRQIQESISHMNMDALVGKHVKRAFDTGLDNPTMEHMWVKVLMVDTVGKNLVGYLDSAPLFVKDYQHMSAVNVAFNEIEEIYS